MGKAFLGFVVGVALTSLAFVLLGSAKQSTGSPSVVAETARQDVVRTSQVDDSRSDDGVLSAAAEPQVEVTVPSPLDLLASVVDDISREELNRLREQFFAAYVQAGIELGDKELAARPVLLPSPLPPEFDWVSENINADYFHESFQREVRDEAWASAAESDLLSHISDQFEFTQKYGYPTVECRTTRCIAKFVGYGVDEDGRVAQRELSAARRAVLQASNLLDCIQQPFEYCTSEAHNEDGVTTLYLGIRRNAE